MKRRITSSPGQIRCISVSEERQPDDGFLRHAVFFAVKLVAIFTDLDELAKLAKIVDIHHAIN